MRTNMLFDENELKAIKDEGIEYDGDVVFDCPMLAKDDIVEIIFWRPNTTGGVEGYFKVDDSLIHIGIHDRDQVSATQYLYLSEVDLEEFKKHHEY